MAIQILPTAPGFAQGLGQGLVNTLIPQFQQQYQRNLVKNSMNEVKDLAKNPDATAFDLASALISSTAGVPGAEKYIGQLFPILNDQLQRQRSLKNSPLGAAGGQGAQGQQSLENTVKQIQKATEKTTPKLKAGGVPEQAEAQEIESPPSVFNVLPPAEYNPALSAPGQIPSMQLPYPDPRAYQNIRIAARQQGYTPQMEDQFVNEAKEANDAAKQSFIFQQAQYQQTQQEKQDYLKNFQEIEKYISSNAKEFGDPDDKQLALQLGEKIALNEGGSPQEVLSKVKQELRPYQAAVETIKNNKRPLFGLRKSQQDKLKKDARLMIDMGQKDKLNLILAANGYGDLEAAKLTNDLPEPMQDYFKQKIDKKEKIVDPRDSVPHRLLLDPEAPDSEEYWKYFNKGLEKKNKQVGEIEDYLYNNFTSGDYKNPGTNLLLVRKNLQDLGMTWEEASETIQRVLEKKSASDPNFKGDAQQRLDFTKLTVPPLYGDGEHFLQNQLNYWFFGKE